MKKPVHWAFVTVLLCGCGKSGTETMVETDTAPADQVAAVKVSQVDASKLLASTLEKAKAEEKRVMVHLGAPW